jgi:hypothetical protein
VVRLVVAKECTLRGSHDQEPELADLVLQGVKEDIRAAEAVVLLDLVQCPLALHDRVISVRGSEVTMRLYMPCQFRGNAAGARAAQVHRRMQQQQRQQEQRQHV